MLFGSAMHVAFSSGTVSLLSHRQRVNGIREHHSLMREELVCSHLNNIITRCPLLSLPKVFKHGSYCWSILSPCIEAHLEVHV